MFPDTTERAPHEYQQSSGRLLSFGARVLQMDHGAAAISDVLAELVQAKEFTYEELQNLRTLSVHRKWQLAAGVLRTLRIDPLEFVLRCLAKLRLSPECLSDQDWATIHFWLVPHCPRTIAD